MTPDFQKIADLFQLESDGPTEPIVENVRKLKGETAEESAELAHLSLRAGQYEMAIKHFKTAIDQRGTIDPALAVDLGAAYEYGDQAPQAYRRYQEALRLRDEHEAHLGLSDLFKRQGRVQDSLHELEVLIANEPTNPYFRIKLAETLREMGYPKRALIAAQQAVITKPDESFYHYWIGDLLIELGRYDEALESLRAAVEMSPGDDFLYLRVAVAFWRLGRHQEAVKSVRMASDLDPDKNLYHGILEALLEEDGLLEEADLESGRADKMDPYDHECVRRTLADMGIEE